tara:strand:- start:741 stop:983 length:243 start_codon:yes stop_codon:yes gene_type:complete
MITQLDPPLPLITPKGEGYAHFVIDLGIEMHLQWVVFMDDTGECWTYENPEIRMQSNITLGRTPEGITKIKNLKNNMKTV